MNILMLLATLSLGLSENIAERLPEDPGMIYTVGFEHGGVDIGLDWKNHQIVPDRVCRKASTAKRPQCQQAALDWLQSECQWYDAKGGLSRTQRSMQNAVCTGAKSLARHISSQQLVKR